MRPHTAERLEDLAADLGVGLLREQPREDAREAAPVLAQAAHGLGCGRAHRVDVVAQAREDLGRDVRSILPQHGERAQRRSPDAWGRVREEVRQLVHLVRGAQGAEDRAGARAHQVGVVLQQPRDGVRVRLALVAQLQQRRQGARPDLPVLVLQRALDLAFELPLVAVLRLLGPGPAEHAERREGRALRLPHVGRWPHEGSARLQRQHAVVLRLVSEQLSHSLRAGERLRPHLPQGQRRGAAPAGLLALQLLDDPLRRALRLRQEAEGQDRLLARQDVRVAQAVGHDALAVAARGRLAQACQGLQRGGPSPALAQLAADRVHQLAPQRGLHAPERGAGRCGDLRRLVGQVLRHLLQERRVLQRADGPQRRAPRRQVGVLQQTREAQPRRGPGAAGADGAERLRGRLPHCGLLAAEQLGHLPRVAARRLAQALQREAGLPLHVDGGAAQVGCNAGGAALARAGLAVPNGQSAQQLRDGARVLLPVQLEAEAIRAGGCQKRAHRLLAGVREHAAPP
mmetsp:Transcript_24683/g.78164  ORF Transcript_24683/g.78164 Transcript_24683/m.78164 type:complete len:514 (-) Transcript_24683:82-1623(-)